MNKFLKTVVLIAGCVGVLALPSVLSASNGPTGSTTFSPTVDGTVIDVDADTTGDVTYDGLGSVVVGLNHPALDPGEDRGVFEFSLASLGRRCVSSADLLLNVAGSFSAFDFSSPNFTLYAAEGDGVLTTADYASAIPIQYLAIYGDVAVDVTDAVRRAMSPPFGQSETKTVRFLLAWNWPSMGVSAGLLFGSNEQEQAFGPEYRSAKLAVDSTPGACRDGD